MRKLLFCVAVVSACLLSAPRPSAAAVPCASTCCLSFMNESSRCMYPATVWTTCGAYWAQFPTVCP